jgi:hypothetical protein
MRSLSLLLLGAAITTALSLPAPAADEKKRLDPANLDTINTKADEDEPHAGSNGLVLYYASNARGKFELMQTVRAAPAQKWRAGTPLDLNFEIESDARSLFVTAEGRFPQFLYFAQSNGKNWVLCTAIRPFAGKGFSTRTLFSAEADEMHPWLTADGRQLYFSRKTADGWRVFVSGRASDSGVRGFDPPELVKDLPPDFHHATLTPDGRTMYLQGPLEGGRWGLFVTARTANGWAKPEPLDLLNHPDGPTGDRSPNLSRDGAVLYFASDRPGGKGGLDLYAIATAQLKKK